MPIFFQDAKMFLLLFIFKGAIIFLYGLDALIKEHDDPAD